MHIRPPSCRRIASSLAVALLVLPLSACFIVSDTPLVGRDSAVQPFSGVVHLVPLENENGRMVEDREAKLVELTPDAWRYRRTDVSRAGEREPRGFVTFQRHLENQQGEYFFVEAMFASDYVYGFGVQQQDGERSVAIFATLTAKEVFVSHMARNNLTLADFPFLREEGDRLIATSVEGLPELLQTLSDLDDAAEKLFYAFYEVRPGPAPVSDVAERGSGSPPAPSGSGPPAETEVTEAPSPNVQRLLEADERLRQLRRERAELVAEWCAIMIRHCNRGCQKQDDGSYLYNTRDGEHWFGENGRLVAEADAPDFGCPQ